jgi:hypothetical protein
VRFDGTSLSIAEWSARLRTRFLIVISGKYRTNAEVSVVCLALLEVRIKKGLRRSGGGCRRGR